MLTKGEAYGNYYIVDKEGSYIIVDDLSTMKNISAKISKGQNEFLSFDSAAEAIDNYHNIINQILENTKQENTNVEQEDKNEDKHEENTNTKQEDKNEEKQNYSPILPKSTTINGLKEKYNFYSGIVFAIMCNNSYVTANNKLTPEQSNDNIKIYFDRDIAKKEAKYRKNGDIANNYYIVSFHCKNGILK